MAQTWKRLIGALRVRPKLPQSWRPDVRGYAWTAEALRSVRSDHVGRLGEQLWTEQLESRGFRIVGNRVKTDCGELDIVAWRGAELWCFEVKTSRGRPEGRGPRHAPGRRFGIIQRARVRRAAWSCARTLGARRAPRTALVEVWVDGRGGLIGWRVTDGE